MDDFATKAALFVVVFAVSTLLLWANATLGVAVCVEGDGRGFRRRSIRASRPFERRPGHGWGRTDLRRRHWYGVCSSWPSRSSSDCSSPWARPASGTSILRFLYQAPYGRNDPLFDKDIGFYLFSLPVYVAIKNWLLWILLLASLMAGSIYFLHGDISLDPRPWRFSSAAIAHGSALLGLYFAVKAWSYALDRYLLLYNDNGVVVGAGYADVHVELPALWLLIWPCRRCRDRLVGQCAAAHDPPPHRSAVGGVRRLVLVRRRGSRAIRALLCQAERTAVGEAVHSAEHRPHPGSVQPRPDHGETIRGGTGSHLSVAQDDSGTVNNIRLWDWQPLMDTYAQLQEIRTYYRFLDVDVDRYHLDGSYQQVMLSARELDPSLLSANAQTWVNLHLLFTHGNGMVMSPVTQKSAEGLPNFYLKDIPPVATGGPPITEPRIYFGQSDAGYVIVKGSTPEFDYPKGKDNVYANYDGADGIPIGGIGWRALFAW